jgi:ketosteroid isomerase-like protein
MPLDRQTVVRFFATLASRDPDRIASLVDDHVEWLIVGPLELFPFCGHHFGKSAVVEAYRQMAKLNDVTSFDIEQILIDGDRASALVRGTGRNRQTGRELNLLIAEFVRFRNEKVIEFIALLDGLSVAEQMFGHSLDLVGLMAGSEPDPALVPATQP